MENTKAVQTIFEIPECNMFILSQKIEILNKKAKRLKCDPISTRVISSEVKRVAESILLETGDYKQTYFDRTYFNIEILGASPLLPGWIFLGTLQHEDAGNIIRAVPGFEIPEKYRQGKQKCDHCQKIRNRKDTYIVRSEAGETKQIGHNCVRDFLGHVSPQALALFATFLKEMQDVRNEDYGGGGWFERSINPITFLQYAAQCIIDFGFVSKTAAQAYMDKSGGTATLETTSAKSWGYLFPTEEMKKRGDFLAITEDAFRLGREALEWVKGLTPKDNFEHNLKMVLSKDVLIGRDAGFAAAAVSSYQRFIGKQIEREKKAKYGENSKHFGEVGKRDIFELTVLGTNVFESQWHEDGLTLFRMQDIQGNLAVWFSGTGSLEVGKTYKLKATVKRHDNYKGFAQTVLNRCKIIIETQTGKAIK